MSIKEIIQGCKINDRKYQRELYLLTANDVMRTISRYITDTSTAKDIFQDTYIKIFDKIHQFDSSRGTIGAWTGRIAANMALAAIRKKTPMVDLEQVPATSQPIADENVIAKLDADDLMQIVYRLPESYRVIFIMYVVDGFSHKEIAQKLSLSESTSRSQLTRARRKLVEYIEQNEKPKSIGSRTPSIRRESKKRRYGNA